MLSTNKLWTILQLAQSLFHSIFICFDGAFSEPVTFLYFSCWCIVCSFLNCYCWFGGDAQHDWIRVHKQFVEHVSQHPLLCQLLYICVCLCVCASTLSCLHFSHRSSVCLRVFVHFIILQLFAHPVFITFCFGWCVFVFVLFIYKVINVLPLLCWCMLQNKIYLLLLLLFFFFFLLNCVYFFCRLNC